MISTRWMEPHRHPWPDKRKARMSDEAMTEEALAEARAYLKRLDAALIGDHAAQASFGEWELLHCADMCRLAIWQAARIAELEQQKFDVEFARGQAKGAEASEECARDWQRLAEQRAERAEQRLAAAEKVIEAAKKVEACDAIDYFPELADALAAYTKEPPHA